MPVALALIVGIVMLAAILLGLLWAVAILLPFYAIVAAALYWIWRSNRKFADLSASGRLTGSGISTSKRCARGVILLSAVARAILGEKRCWKSLIAYVSLQNSKISIC